MANLTLAQMLALLPDNITGQISAQDVRDIITALAERTDGTNPLAGILFNTSPSIPAHTPGHVHWNDQDGVLEIMSEISDVVLQVGQEVWVNVRNNSGSTILNGRPVRLTGASGNRPTVGLDDGLGQLIGIATHDIPNNTNGMITSFGVVRGVDTSAFTDGQAVYASATGTLTGTLTSSRVGHVLLAHVSNGAVLSDPDRRTHASGTTAARPTTIIQGFMYFDTTLGMPIFWNGASWVDATGSGV